MTAVYLICALVSISALNSFAGEAKATSKFCNVARTAFPVLPKSEEEVWTQINERAQLCLRKSPDSVRDYLNWLLLERVKVAHLEGDLDVRRSVLSVLGSALQEVLYSHGAVFGNEKIIRVESPWRERRSEKCETSYQGVKICPGDVFVSRGLLLSAATLGLRTRFSQLYTHSRVAIRTSAKIRKTVFLESDIQGTILTNEQGSPDLVEAIFRAPKVLSQLHALEGALDQFIYKKLGTSTLPQNDFSVKIAEFSPSMHVNCDGKGYFCSEILHCLYRDSVPLHLLNPYPESLWSVDAPAAQFFLSRVVDDVKSLDRFPLPGDIEFEASYFPIAWFLKPMEALENRAVRAIAEAYSLIVNKDKNLSDRLVAAYHGKKDRDFDSMSLVEVQDSLKALLMDPALARAIQTQFPKGRKLHEVLFISQIYFGLGTRVKQSLQEWQGAQGTPVNYAALLSKAQELVKGELESFIRARKEKNWFQRLFN